MAMMKGDNYVPGKPKKTRQGRSSNTLLSATSRNKKKKAYRGQGKQEKIHLFMNGSSYMQSTLYRSMGKKRISH